MQQVFGIEGRVMKYEAGVPEFFWQRRDRHMTQINHERIAAARIPERQNSHFSPIRIEPGVVAPRRLFG